LSPKIRFGFGCTVLSAGANKSMSLGGQREIVKLNQV